jgi:hypothetical protein
MSQKKFVLSKPIKVAGEEVRELSYRDPSVDDADACGEMPYSMQRDGIPIPRPAACVFFISRMAGIPPSSVKQMSGWDFNMLSQEVISFFWVSPLEA